MATSSFYNSSGSTPAVANSIQTAVTQAAGSATQAATSATQANTSATNAQNSLNSFQQYYLGAYTSAPSTTQSGAMYFNTSVGQLYIWSGSSWDVTASANNLQDTDGLSEGSTNLYFTNARAASAITGSDLDMNGNKVLFANVYTSEVNLPSASTYHGMFAHVHGTGKGYFAHAGSWHKLLDETSSTTTDLSEGSNLYYTDERVDDRVSNLLTAGSNITLTYNDTANTLTIASTASGGGGSTTFTGLTDTPSSMGTSGQYLAVNSGGNALEFVAAPSGGATTLSGLTDVSNATPANGQVLTYDTSTSLWQPITPSGGSSGSTTFTGLTDTPSSFTATKFLRANSGGTALEYATALTPSNLTVTNNAASGGGSVSYIPGANGATLSFIPPDLSSYLTGITGQSLYNLSNVNSSASPSDGQVLAWDNANSYWTPVAASSGGGGIALTDLSATTGAAGTAALSYNSTTGVFTLTPPDLSGYATTSSLSSYATTSSLATVATSGAYGDLTGTPNLSSYLTGITGESLYSLSNVYTSSSPTDGQVLTWDNANSYWKPTTVSGGSGGIALTDLSAGTVTATGGGSLSYNNTTGQFLLTPPDLSGYATTASLATVATSGAYSDLTGAPAALTNTDGLTEGSTNLYHTTARARSSISANNAASASGGGSIFYNQVNGQMTFYPPDLSSYLTDITGQSLYSLSNVNTSASPSDGQVLTWSNANSYWTPTTVSSGSAPPWLATTSTTAATTNTRAKSLALGSGATVNAGNSLGSALQKAIAIGDNATVAGTQGIIIGTDQTVEYASTVVAASEGVLNNGTGQNCTVIGDGYHITGVNRNGVTLLGAGTLGTNYSTAIGYLADAQHSYSVGLGYDATTTQANQLMLGDTTTTEGFTSIRVGNNSYQPSNAKDLTTKDYVDNRQLADLSDVNNTQPTDGQVLTWDNTNAYWYPATASGGGGGSSSYVDVNSSGTAPSATGTEGIAIGATASSASDYAVLVGYGATATGANGIAVGRIAEADGQHGMGLGYWARGQHLRSTALGYASITTASDQLMLGATSSYGGFTSIRVGNTNYTPTDAMDLATKQYVDAQSGGGGGSSYVDVNSSGTAASAGGTNAIAIGQNANAPISDSIAIGQNAAVGSSAWQGIAIGLSSNASNVQSVAIGEQAGADGSYQVSLGSYTQCGSSHTYGISIGNNASTGGTQAITMGRYAFAQTEGVAIGGASGNLYRTRAGTRSVAIGYLANANSTYTVAVGANSYGQNGNYSTSVGYGSNSAGNYSIALGYNANSTYQGYITLGSTSNTTLRCNATSITSLSDSRDKTEITDLDLGLDFVNAIVPKSFYRNERGKYYTPAYTPEQLEADDTLEQSYTFDQAGYEAASQKHNKKEFGWVAQDVEAQLPDAHSDARLTYIETDDLQDFDVYRFTAGDMLPIAWKALRELSDKHDQLQSDYDALLARVVALENA